MDPAGWPEAAAFALEKQEIERFAYAALENLRADGFLAWDEDHLYLAVMVEDNIHEKAGSGGGG